MTDATPERPANRLAGETSPYLLQHAHNPVDWFPWGEEALTRARREGKLILLSIGYSACHWCHVMERESFEDETIAGLMNERFVNVKVDREERPDLDEIYMAATVAMNQGQGGWPMTVFLTPDLEPVYTGTYFPPRDMYGRPGFPSVLRAVADAWQREPARLRDGARELTEHLRRQSAAAMTPVALDASVLETALEQFAGDYDRRWGGFGGAPKFPPATAVRLLLRLHHRYGDARALEMARGTLDAMARGGIHDQLGGGFHRYAVDREWLVPHFEKMLYDNALLAVAYLEGWQVTGDDEHRRVAAATLDYLLREMTSPEGAFYSATDADSEGEEGKFFVWTPDELRAHLGDDEAAAVAATYDVTEDGNWEGKSILHTPRPAAEVAAELGIDEAELERRLAAARPVLYEARARRVAPGLDDKVLTAWNGLAIAACAEGHRILGDERYLAAATRAADFVLAHLVDAAGTLLRSWRAGKAQHRAVLEDHAYLAEGLLALYETGGERRFLDRALELAERICRDFGDDFADAAGGFYHTPAGRQDLLLRYREGTDGATPAANATAADVLVRLAVHTGRDDLRRRGTAALEAWGDLVQRVPRAFAKTLLTVDFLAAERAGDRLELALAGRPGDADLRELAQATGAHFLPHRVQAVADPDDAEAARDLPLVTGKDRVNGHAALYVCRDFTCRAPVTDPREVASALAAVSSAS